MTSPINLAELPPLNLIEELGFEQIQSEMREALVAEMPELEAALELDSDPLVKLIQIFAAREQVLRAEYNQSARAVTLAFATGSDLEHLGALVPLRRFEGESQEDYRARLQFAPEGFSVAGPASAYRSLILNKDARTEDVRVTSPEPGQILCEVLLTRAAVNEFEDILPVIRVTDDERPETDLVEYRPANIDTFDVNAEIELQSGPGRELVLASAEEALRAYSAGRRRFGGSVPLTGIIAALHVPGVERVKLIAPVEDIELGEAVVPQLAELTLTEVGDE